MSSWKGKSRGTPLGYRIFIFLLKKGGLRPAYSLLKFVTCYYFLFSYQSSKELFNLYRKRLKLSVFKSLFLIYRNYYSLGQSIIDKIVITNNLPHKFTFDFDGEENLKNIATTQKGGILLSAHIGSWDVAGYLLNRLNTKINIVLFDGEDEQIKKFISISDRKKIGIIPIKKDLSHIYKISEAFERNELICMHADRFIEGNKTIGLNFLGANAPLPLGPFLLAASFRVPVSFVFAVKESINNYHLFATEPLHMVGTKREQVIENLTNKFIFELEKKIKAYPTQWYNYHKFWQ